MKGGFSTYLHLYLFDPEFIFGHITISPSEWLARSRQYSPKVERMLVCGWKKSPPLHGLLLWFSTPFCGKTWRIYLRITTPYYLKKTWRTTNGGMNFTASKLGEGSKFQCKPLESRGLCYNLIWLRVDNFRRGKLARDAAPAVKIFGTSLPHLSKNNDHSLTL